MEAKQPESSSPTSPPPLKKARCNDSLNGKECTTPSTSKDRPPLPGARSRGLTSDAVVTEGEVLASQFIKQPVNIWYGKGRRTIRCSSSDCDEPDTPHDVDHAAVQTKYQLRPDGPKPHYVAHSGGDDSPSSDTEDGADVLFQSPVEPVGMALPPSWLSPKVLVPRGRSFDISTIIPSGKNTTIAVLDSGINTEHSAFQVHAGHPSRISPHSKSFVGMADDITDCIGHGTQCAGLVCGSPDLIQTADERVEFSSIAPNARVMVCKVVKDGTAIADLQAVCDAIDHVITYNRQCETAYDKVDVISLSFGMEGFHHTLTNKIQEAVYDDIIVVCAASNNGRKVRQPITYPARLGHVLCIGACTANGKPADFSPVGRELDFLAVGEGAWAPSVGGASAYCVVNGTSFAAPLVAGVVCQLIEDLRRLSEGVVGGGPPLWQRVHNVWCMRELLKEMAAVQGKHCEESGFGALNPLEYFNKNDREKLRIITEKILSH